MATTVVEWPGDSDRLGVKVFSGSGFSKVDFVKRPRYNGKRVVTIYDDMSARHLLGRGFVKYNGYVNTRIPESWTDGDMANVDWSAVVKDLWDVVPESEREGAFGSLPIGFNKVDDDSREDAQEETETVKPVRKTRSRR